MQRTQNANTLRIDFDNILDFAKYVNATPQENDSRNHHYSRYWCPMNFSDTLRDTLTGSVKIDFEKFERIQNSIKEISPSQDKSTYYDVCGNMLDIGRFVTGEPECFENETETEGKEKLTVGISISVSWGARSQDIERRAYWIANIIDHLSRFYFLDIRVFCAITGLPLANTDKDRLVLSFSVSSFPFDTRAIIKACGPCFLRRLIFGAMEMECNKKDLHSYCYGYPDDIIPTEIDGRFLYFPSNRVTPSYVFSYCNDTIANDYVMPILKKLANGERFVIFKEPK